jgi:hypothetical protein
MPFNLSALAGKLIGMAAAAAIVGGIILVQHLKINAQARTIAEQRVQVLTLKLANDHFAVTLDQLTRDLSAFEKRAAVAEAEKIRRETAANAKLHATIRRLTDAATPQDNQPVTPALRSALGVVRRQ